MKKKTKHIDFSTLSDEELARLGKELQSRGHGTDTILAHINPEEAAMLKRSGGSGAVNPATGLTQYDDGGDGGGGDGGGDGGGGDGGGGDGGGGGGDGGGGDSGDGNGDGNDGTGDVGDDSGVDGTAGESEAGNVAAGEAAATDAEAAAAEAAAAEAADAEAAAESDALDAHLALEDNYSRVDVGPPNPEPGSLTGGLLSSLVGVGGQPPAPVEDAGTYVGVNPVSNPGGQTSAESGVGNPGESTGWGGGGYGGGGSGGGDSGGSGGGDSGGGTTTPGPVVPTTSAPRPGTTWSDVNRQTGLSPGFMQAQPFYNTTSDVQSKYYWGGAPMQTGATFNPAQARQIPQAPVVPWGIQEIAKQLTPEETAQLINYMQQQQAPMAPMSPDFLQQLRRTNLR